MPLNQGSIALTCGLSFAVPGGGNVFNGYNFPGNIGLTTPYTTGTGPNQAMKFATLGGTTTVSTPVTTDLTSVVCCDGSTGFTHVREVIAINGDGVNILKYDATVANSFLGSLEATVKFDIAPDGVFRITKPLGTTGFAVSGSTKLITLDPGAFALLWQLFILGD